MPTPRTAFDSPYQNPLIAFGERLISGLSKKAAVMPSRWVLEHVKNLDGTQSSFRRFPWQREMLDSKAPHNCAAKGAQLGISHCILCRAMAANDLEKRDVLYILPSLHPDASNFSNARFDSLVAASQYLSDIYDKGNVGLKRTSTNNFYIRGAQSRSGGKSVPAGFLVLDEINEIPKWFVILVRERMSGQDVKTEWDISTPTVPEAGIDKIWLESSQEHFFFPCPKCSRHIRLTYPECLEVVGDDPDSTQVLQASYLKCPECYGKLEHLDKPNFLAPAKFVAAVTGKEKRGFHVNQLYSATVTPGEVAAASIRARFSDLEAQEFFNSKLGLPHAPEGSKVTEEAVNACKRGHRNLDVPHDGFALRTMGVDVGSRIHFEICEWWVGEAIGDDCNSNSLPRVIRTGFCQSFEQLDGLMHDYRINMCVIDAMPETRMAFAFSQRHLGKVKMCFYAQGMTGRMLKESKWDHGEPIINVNRTMWLDQSLGRFRAATIELPADLPYEYMEHVKVPSRIWKYDKNGNPVVSYDNADKADHHAHSRNYAEIALPLALGVGVHEEVDNPYA